MSEKGGILVKIVCIFIFVSILQCELIIVGKMRRKLRNVVILFGGISSGIPIAWYWVTVTFRCIISMHV